MKIKSILFTLIILFSSINFSYSNPYGEGKLKLTDGMVKYFIQYLRGKGVNKVPSDFYVTLDGTDGIYYTCYSLNNCAPGSAKEDIKACERATGKKCKKFARIRIIKWKNGINPGKGKASKINSKWSDAEIIAKLTELGFVGEETNNVEEETTISKSSKETLEQLESLTQLYKDGHLNKEEFEKAKKIILNSN